MTDNVKFAGLLVFILALLTAGPLLAIWSLNTLFATGIAYTFINWLAMFCLMIIIQARVSK